LPGAILFAIVTIRSKTDYLTESINLTESRMQLLTGVGFYFSPQNVGTLIYI
jgi:hypothetical protein